MAIVVILHNHLTNHNSKLDFSSTSKEFCQQIDDQLIFLYYVLWARDKRFCFRYKQTNSIEKKKCTAAAANKKLSRSKVITVKHVRNDNSFTVNLDKQMVIAKRHRAVDFSLVCTLLNGTHHKIHGFNINLLMITGVFSHVQTEKQTSIVGAFQF